MYSAVICFAALLSRIFLKHKLTWTQLTGIYVLFLGLVVASLDLRILWDEDELSSYNTLEEELKVLIGIGVTLAGCVGYAGSYVLNEYILLVAPSLAPKRLCALVGLWGCLLLGAYLTAYTLPNWDAAVLAPMRARGADPAWVAGLYAGLTASSFLHNLAYFNLLRLTGAVSTGVLTALRTIGVFLASGWLFCDMAPVQCLTSQKLLAVLVICAGVVVSAVGSAAPRAAGSHGAAADGGSARAAERDEEETLAAGMTTLREMLQGVLEGSG